MSNILSIADMGNESFLLKMKDKRSFDVLVEKIKTDFGYSFNQGLKLDENSLEIVISGVSKDSLIRHLGVVSF